MTEDSSKPLIFVVDDDRGLVRLVEKSLQREGYATASAISGAKALAWLGRNRPDLMLLDLKLQDIEGKEVINQLRDIGRLVPFIIITGQGDERVAVEMMKRGALDYIVKDVRFQEFVPTIVQRACEQVRREKRLAAAEEALKKEHAFISAVLDTSGALVVVFDLQGRIVRFNRACETITGYSLDEARSRPFWEFLLIPEELESVKRVFEQLQSGRFPSRHENFWLAKDRGRHRIDWSNSALLDENGAVEYIVATGIDITERKRLEREILEISDREQRRIGQDLHDGLCQRLAGVELMSEVLEQRLAAKSKRDAARAGDIARNVRESINETRLLARGLSPVMLESEGLMSALQELASNTEKMFQVACRFHCLQPVLVDDHAIATHLFRIAQEAVSNAIKHGKARRIDITLDAAGRRFTVQVKDNGVGFPKSARNPQGMGLRIMRYRAGMIGGSLDISSHSQGATVTCSIQRTPPPATPP